MKKFRLLLVTTMAISVLVMAAVLGSCGANPPQTSGAQTTPSDTLTTNPETVRISIENFAFNPGKVTVKAGTTVVWTNNDSMRHDVKADAFSSKLLNKGETFEYRFDTKGIFDYICGIHPSMKGSITVE